MIPIQSAIVRRIRRRRGRHGWRGAGRALHRRAARASSLAVLLLLWGAVGCSDDEGQKSGESPGAATVLDGGPGAGSMDATASDVALTDGGGATVGDVVVDDGGSGGKADGAGAPLDVGDWKPPKDDGTWPIVPWVMPDGRVWLPTRTIDDGKGGKLVIRNALPLRKPKVTQFAVGGHVDGVVQLQLAPGVQAIWKNGAWVGAAGVDVSALNKVVKDHKLGVAARMFAGKPAALQAERLQLEQKHKRAVPDLTRFYLQAVNGDVAAAADAYNASPLVELAWPLPRGQRTAIEGMAYSMKDDKSLPSPDLTAFQGYLFGTGKSSGWGGHDSLLGWSLSGGRGEAVPAAQIESGWNLKHEDLLNGSFGLYSPWDDGDKTSPSEAFEHANAVLGIVKASNNGYGITGMASNAQMGLMPSKPDNLDDWLDADPKLKLLPQSFWQGHYAAKIQYLAGKLPVGAPIFFSLGMVGPTHRKCTYDDDCTPRLECLPAPPYATVDGTNKTPAIWRCEGFDSPGVANNACTTHADCTSRWGFGARCLPVPKKSAGVPFAVKAWHNWRCGGDPNGAECTTSSDCVPRGHCKEDLKGTERCGGAQPPPEIKVAGTAARWPWTASAGGLCGADIDCQVSTDGYCNVHEFCAWKNEITVPPTPAKYLTKRRLVPFEYDPGIHSAISWANAKGVIVIEAAANEHQRLGLLSEDSVLEVEGTKIFNGHDTYIGFYDCPLPGCRQASGGWVVGATNGGVNARAGFSSAGPRIDLNSWGEYVATLDYGDAHKDTTMAGGDIAARHDYTVTFNGTSSATPIIAGVTLQVQGIVKYQTGNLLPPDVALAALQSGATPIPPAVKSHHDYIGGRPNLAKALAYLESQGYLPAGHSNLIAPQLVIENLSAVRFDKSPTEPELYVSFRVRNEGEQISPAIGLKLATGPAGGGSAGAKDAHLFSCLKGRYGEECCTKFSNMAACNPLDLDGRFAAIPMLDGTKSNVSNGDKGGYVDVSFHISLKTTTTPPKELCVTLDAEARFTAHRHLVDAAGTPLPQPTKCVPIVKMKPEFVGLTGTFKFRGVVPHLSPPFAKACGNANWSTLWGFTGTFIQDYAVVTRKQQWILAAFPHAGVIGALQFGGSACQEHDFDIKDDIGTCGTSGPINRLQLAPKPTTAAPCDPAVLTAALGYNPQSIALSRDQRWAAVVMNHLTDPCQPGRLALLDLTQPGPPKLRTVDVGGVQQPLFIPIGPNPKSVVITPEKLKDARIVVAFASDIKKCPKGGGFNTMELKGALDMGAAVTVTTTYFLSGKNPVRVVTDEHSKAAFVAFDDSNAPVGMLRLNDKQRFSFYRKPNLGVGWDRVRDLRAVTHPDGKVRLVFIENFFGKKVDPGTKASCPKDYLYCGALHTMNVDVAAGKSVYYAGAGRMLPVQQPHSLAIDSKHEYAIIGTATKDAHLFPLGGFANTIYGFKFFNQGVTFKFGSLLRLIEVPAPEETFCPDEQCNGADDDCDGVTDNFWADVVDKPCSVGMGICQKSAKVICDPDGTKVICDATPGTPKTELCNGIDDNCDGTVDDPWDQLLGTNCWIGKGICNAKGQRVCKASGKGYFCNAKKGQSVAEICGNGLDDDCDGKTDEDCP
jgi:hypothetical protein